jgi:aminoglycoside phosphotransferase (APT) family kinase protein
MGVDGQQAQRVGHADQVSVASVTTLPGPLLASGRDSDIFEFGPNKVLRRARNARSMAYEASVMDYVRSQGYPVPEVFDLQADGTELIMERVDGPHLLGAVEAKPWRVRRLSGVLAELHKQLHEIPAPPSAPVLDESSTTMVHLDLHPLNVIMSARGPVVIDWTNARRGHWASDVADAWLILSSAAVPGGGVVARVMTAMRSLFVNGFVRHYDRAELCAHLRAAATRRGQDHNMSAAELDNMRRLVDKYAPDRA